MNDSHPLRPQVSPESLAERVRAFFDVGEIRGLTLVHGGYMWHNYRMETERGTFFLKQYRNKISTVVHEIKHAEEYFASQGLPVILPVEDRTGRRAFWVDGHWLSLFPFVDAHTPTMEEMDGPLARNLGDMLGRFHEAGCRFPDRNFQPLRLWNQRKFFMEFAELEYELMKRKEPTDLEARMLEVLRRKADLARSTRETPGDFSVAYDSLLHGDFIYQNTFVSPSHEVTHVYDLEKTVIGPRGYELARSLFISCFDDAAEERNFVLGRQFLDAYRARVPVTFDEFERGARLYMLNLRHMNWIESRYLIFGIETHLPLYQRHVNRLEWTVREGDSIARRLYE